MFFDSHAHLTSDALYPNLKEILLRARKAEVSKMMCICTDIETTERALTIQDPNIGLIGATTPHDVEKEGEEFFPQFARWAKEGVFKAIGETGLDYHYEHSKKTIQQAFLIRYFTLAKEFNLPVVIHCRDAFDDLFAIADSHFAKEKCLLHCFTGTMEEAKKCLERGWTISCSGIVTFKKSLQLQEVMKMIPLSSLMIETDSPYLAPGIHRGKQNEPGFLPETARFLAHLKGDSLEQIASITFANASRFFGM